MLDRESMRVKHKQLAAVLECDEQTSMSIWNSAIGRAAEGNRGPHGIGSSVYDRERWRATVHGEHAPTCWIEDNAVRCIIFEMNAL